MNRYKLNGVLPTTSTTNEEHWVQRNLLRNLLLVPINLPGLTPGGEGRRFEFLITDKLERNKLRTMYTTLFMYLGLDLDMLLF